MTFTVQKTVHWSHDCDVDGESWTASVAQTPLGGPGVTTTTGISREHAIAGLLRLLAIDHEFVAGHPEVDGEQDGGVHLLGHQHHLLEVIVVPEERVERPADRPRIDDCEGCSFCL